MRAQGRSDPGLGLGLASSPRLQNPATCSRYSLACNRQVKRSFPEPHPARLGWGRGASRKGSSVCWKGSCAPKPRNTILRPGQGTLRCLQEGHSCGHLPPCPRYRVRWPSVLWKASGGQKAPGWRPPPSFSFHIRKLPLEMAQMPPSRTLVRQTPPLTSCPHFSKRQALAVFCGGRGLGGQSPRASLRGAAEQGPSALGMRPSRPSLELAPSRKCRPSTAWRWLPPSCPAGRAGRGRRGPHARGVRPHRRRLDVGLGPAEGTEVTVGDVGGFRSCQMRSHPAPRFLCCNQAGAGVLGGGSGGAPSPDP